MDVKSSPYGYARGGRYIFSRLRPPASRNLSLPVGKKVRLLRVVDVASCNLRAFIVQLRVLALAMVRY